MTRKPHVCMFTDTAACSMARLSVPGMPTAKPCAPLWIPSCAAASHLPLSCVASVAYSLSVAFMSKSTREARKLRFSF